MLTFLLNLYARFRFPKLRDVYQISLADGSKARVIVAGNMNYSVNFKEIMNINVYDYRTPGFNMHRTMADAGWRKFLKDSKAVYLGRYCQVAEYHGTLPKRLK